MPVAASERCPVESLGRCPAAVRKTAVVARDERDLRAGLDALVPQFRIRALHLCGEAATADDIVQDTVERALLFSHQYERGTNLRAWALQVLFSVSYLDAARWLGIPKGPS